mmetsp:Transcript_1230/g.3000  ORF Transcript_1230/g.3000 Transcript_1230/m.3000 type:complete len:503 (+) Transcript_1230:106-1614(+)
MSWLDPELDDAAWDAIENPTPQPRPDRQRTGDPVPLQLAGMSLSSERDRVAIVMVGLPGSFKTLLCKRMASYLEFFHSLHVKRFTVSEYLRTSTGRSTAEHTEDGRSSVEACWGSALNDLKAFFLSDSQLAASGEEEGEALDEESGSSGPPPGCVGFLDALNLSRGVRKQVSEELNAIGVRTVFVESIANEPSVVRACFLATYRRSSEYKDLPESEALEKFEHHRDELAKMYEEIDAQSDEAELSWVKLTNLQTIVIHRVRTYISGRLVQFLLNFHPFPRTIYLSRHGQSEYNDRGKVGGDSNLTARGTEYAQRLAKYAEEVICRDSDGELRPARLWTSTLMRTRQTAAFIRHPTCERGGQPFVVMREKRWTNLDEIYAGICDGMTYPEIKDKYPEEAKRRAENKLSYRYPRGESYMDLIARLEPIAHELERHREPLLIVSHQAVLRVIYCYLKGIPREQAPLISMPLHTIVKLEPHAYDCDEERVPLMLDSEGNPQDTPSH